MGSLVTFPQSVDAQLRFAIAHRRLVQLTYNGKTRVVEPHDYGVLNGAAKLLAFQRPVWRTFDVSRIERLSVLTRTFAGGRGNPRQHHLQWDVLYARVAAPDPHA